MKKMIDDNQVHEANYEAILNHVKEDPFAKSLGIELTRFGAGSAEAVLEIKEHMVNAYGTVHGAVIYALADHAFSAACNAYGKVTLGLSTTIQFIMTAKPGDKIVAQASELRRNFRTGYYRIDILHEDEYVATMEAVSYTKNHYFVQMDNK